MEREQKSQTSFGLLETPRGKPYVGMMISGERWALLTVKEVMLAELTRRQLKTDFQIEGMLGTPFNWRQSLKDQELKLVDAEGVVGVYIPEEAFDKIIYRMSGT